MKRLGFVLFLFLVSSVVFSQVPVSEVVSVCTRFLGNGVPEGFSIMDNNSGEEYEKFMGETGSYIIKLENGKVVLSSYMVALSYSKLLLWTTSIDAFFQKAGWRSRNLSQTIVLFEKDSLFSVFMWKQKGASFAVILAFSNDLSVLLD